MKKDRFVGLFFVFFSKLHIKDEIYFMKKGEKL